MCAEYHHSCARVLQLLSFQLGHTPYPSSLGCFVWQMSRYCNLFSSTNALRKRFPSQAPKGLFWSKQRSSLLGVRRYTPICLFRPLSRPLSSDAHEERLRYFIVWFACVERNIASAAVFVLFMPSHEHSSGLLLIIASVALKIVKKSWRLLEELYQLSAKQEREELCPIKTRRACLIKGQGAFSFRYFFSNSFSACCSH